MTFKKVIALSVSLSDIYITAYGNADADKQKKL